MLKFENVASVGDTIRAYDFKPMAGREDCFIEGVVVSKGRNNGIIGTPSFTIEVTKQVFSGKKKRLPAEKLLMVVPFEVSFMEYDARIMNLSK